MFQQEQFSASWVLVQELELWLRHDLLQVFQSRFPWLLVSGVRDDLWCFSSRWCCRRTRTAFRGVVVEVLRCFTSIYAFLHHSFRQLSCPFVVGFHPYITKSAKDVFEASLAIRSVVTVFALTQCSAARALQGCLMFLNVCLPW